MCLRSYFFFFCLAAGISPQAYAQLLQGLVAEAIEANYVPNPSFEVTRREYCKWNQNGREYMQHIAEWDSPTETTPDIFSLRLKPTCWANPRYHSDGKQGPRNGDNMAGLKTHGKGGTETFWHEYLSVQLDTSLKPGIRYYAEFYANRAVRCDEASNNIGLAFSQEELVTRDRMPLYITPAVNSDEIIKSRWNIWKKISGVFEVDREMKYLLIGNFYSDDETQITDFPEGEGGAYYYIDDVMIRRARPDEALTPKPRASVAPKPKKVLQEEEVVSTKEINLDSIDYKIGNTITLQNIFFEFDKADLLPASTSELSKLVNIMSDYPYLQIEISGHTDNVGTESYNKKLSEARAKSVSDYLLKANVEAPRVQYRGYGSTRPQVSNDSDEGRAKNRRVEFTVLQN